MADLAAVRPVLERPGPFTTVHLDVSRTAEDHRQQLEARLTNTRHTLEHAGIDAALIEEIGDRLREQTHATGEVRRTLVAEQGEVVFDDVRLGHTSWPETVATGPLPDLAGWASQLDGGFPFVLVRADRRGADIEAYAAASRPPVARTEVEGTEWDLTKLPEGDWAQDRYQRRAENNWEANARLVAAEVDQLRRRLRPRLVVLAGDVRARADLAELLDEGGAGASSVAQIESGGRAAGASEEAMWTDVMRLLANLEASAHHDLVEVLERGTARSEGVAGDLDQVVDSLVLGEVDTVVLDLAVAHDLRVDPGRHPGLPLPDGALTAGPLPADQVLLAAAALTGAGLSLLPRDLTPGERGVAATLRWS